MSPPDYDRQQDLTRTFTGLSNGLRILNFTRPIISTDKQQDIDLNACRYVRWAYGGTAMLDQLNEASIITLPTRSGAFGGQICLQECRQGIIDR